MEEQWSKLRNERAKLEEERSEMKMNRHLFDMPRSHANQIKQHAGRMAHVHDTSAQQDHSKLKKDVSCEVSTSSSACLPRSAQRLTRHATTPSASG